MKRILIFLFFATAAGATSRTWTGLGVGSNWSTAANWSPSGAAANGDNLTFDNTCTLCNATADTALTNLQLTLASTYTGTLTQSANLAINSVVFSGGTWNATGFTLTLGHSGGAPDTSITCSGNFNTATGVTSISIDASSRDYTVNSGCTISAQFIAGSLNVQSGATFNVVTAFTGAISTIAGTFVTTVDMTLQGGVNITGTFTATGRTITVNNSNVSMTCVGNFNSNSGAASVVLTHDGSRTFTLNSGCNLTASMTTGGAVQVNSGATFNTVTSFVGSIANSGTFNSSIGLSLTGLNNTGTMNLSGVTITISGNFNSSFSCNSNFNSSTSVSSVVVNLVNVRQFNLQSTCNLTASLGSADNTMQVLVDASATLQAAGPTDTFNTITNNGTFKGSTGTVTVTGSWTNSGTFTHNNGTIAFSDAAHTIAGSATFFNLSMATSAAARTLTFTAGTTQTIAGALTLTGSSGKVLSLRSSATPSVWTINPQGTKSVAWVDVKDSTNSATPPIYAGTHSTDSGHNTNWIFTDPPSNVSRHNSGFIME